MRKQKHQKHQQSIRMPYMPLLQLREAISSGQGLLSVFRYVCNIYENLHENIPELTQLHKNQHLF